MDPCVANGHEMDPCHQDIPLLPKVNRGSTFALILILTTIRRRDPQQSPASFRIGRSFLKVRSFRHAFFFSRPWSRFWAGDRQDPIRRAVRCCSSLYRRCTVEHSSGAWVASAEHSLRETHRASSRRKSGKRGRVWGVRLRRRGRSRR